MAEQSSNAASIPSRASLSAPHANKRSNCEEEVVQLFDELRSPVLRYLAGIGLSMADAEEVVQETFLALFQHLSAGKARHNLRGWVFRVARNLGLKRRARETRCEVGDGALIADSAPDPESQYAEAQREARLRAVVAALAEQDRECLYLRAEGLRYREIAQVLGISLGAISLSLSRSVARMTRALGGGAQGT